MNLYGVMMSPIFFGGPAECSPLTLPGSFSVEETSSFFGSNFVVQTPRGQAATITQKLLSFATTYEVKDKQGGLVATGSQVVFTWGKQMDVVDCGGQMIGSIKVQITASGFPGFARRSTATSKIEVLNPSGGTIATSGEFARQATNFQLKTAGNKILAKMRRPTSGSSTKWQTDVVDSSVIDPRILILVGVFKAEVDKRWEKAEKNEEENIQRKQQIDQNKRREKRRSATRPSS